MSGLSENEREALQDWFGRHAYQTVSGRRLNGHADDPLEGLAAVVETILAARLAPIEALADEWDLLASDAAWAVGYRMAWKSSAGQLRAALTATEEPTA